MLDSQPEITPHETPPGQEGQVPAACAATTRGGKAMFTTVRNATTLFTAPRLAGQEGARRAWPPVACARYRVLVVVLLGSLGGLAMAGHSATDDAQNATLRGLSGVRVLIAPLDPKLERAGLTAHQLQTDVEHRLQQAEVRVLTEEERRGVRGTPTLSVKVDGLLAYNSQGLAAYTMSVEVYQEARLEANGASALAMTWRVGSITLVGSANLPTGIRNAVRALVDQFIDAYLRVTPRPAGSLAPSAAATGRDLIRQVQQRLQAGGYTPGTVDGALGLQTRQALRGFQKAKGLRPTGEPDTATLDALGLR